MDPDSESLPEPLARLGGGPWCVPRDCTWILATPDGSSLITGGHGSLLYRVDAESGEVRQLLEVASRNTSGPALHADGRRLVWGDFDRNLGCVDLETGEELWRVETPHLGSVQGVSLVPGGRHVLSHASEHTLYIWNAETGRKAGPGKQLESYIRSAHASPDGRTVAAVHHAGGLAWDRVDGTESWRTDAHSLHGGIGEEALAFTHGGRRIWFAASEAPFLRVYDLEDGAAEGRESFAVETDNWLRTLRASPDASRLVAMTRERFYLIDAEDGALLCDRPVGETGLHPADHLLAPVVFSPSGDRIWALTGDRRILAHSATDGELLNPWPLHQKDVVRISLSSDGRRLHAVTRVPELHVWDVDRGECLEVTPQEEPGYPPRSTPSPDGTLEARSGNDRITLHLVGEEEPTMVLAGHVGTIHSRPLFFPDGRLLLCPGQDRCLRIWSLVRGELVLEYEDPALPAGYGPPAQLAVDEERALLAIQSTEGSVLLLELRRHLVREPGETVRLTRRRQVRLHQGNYARLALSEDGSRLAVCADLDREVRVHDTEALLERFGSPVGG